MKQFTPTHKNYLNSMYCKSTPISVAIGPAGTGKTYLACTAAIKQLTRKEISKIVITRPTKNVDEDTGYLPGDIGSKMLPYMRPIYDCFLENIKKDQLKKYLDSECIEICPIAYMRGRTFHNTFIIADECQNTSVSQMKMLLTRIGVDSKMVITGDLLQSDIKEQTNGLDDLIKRCEKLYEISDESCVNIIRLDENDMLRNDVVIEILKLYEMNL